MQARIICHNHEILSVPRNHFRIDFFLIKCCGILKRRYFISTFSNQLHLMPFCNIGFCIQSKYVIDLLNISRRKYPKTGKSGIHMKSDNIEIKIFDVLDKKAFEKYALQAQARRLSNTPVSGVFFVPTTRTEIRKYI